MIGILKIKEGWTGAAGLVLAVGLGILGGEFHSDVMSLEWKNHLATASVGGLTAAAAVLGRRLA